MSATEHFSLAAYRRILRAVLARGYRIVPAGDAPVTFDRVLYLRHDVDFSPAIAAELGRVNAELGVRGAFHVPVCSPLFNLAAEPCQGALAELRRAGQPLALHYYLPEACRSAPMTFDGIVADIHRQHSLLAAAAGSAVLPAMSWHNPSLLEGQHADWVYADVPGLANLYRLGRHGVSYRSDSNNRLTVAEWLAAAEALDGPAQWLFHPFQWVCGDSDMRRVLARTWAAIVGAQQPTFLTNKVYREALPGGVPAQAFERLVEAWLQGAADE